MEEVVCVAVLVASPSNDGDVGGNASKKTSAGEDPSSGVAGLSGLDTVQGVDGNISSNLEREEVVDFSGRAGDVGGGKFALNVGHVGVLRARCLGHVPCPAEEEVDGWGNPCLDRGLQVKLEAGIDVNVDKAENVDVGVNINININAGVNLDVDGWQADLDTSCADDGRAGLGANTDSNGAGSEENGGQHCEDELVYC